MKNCVSCNAPMKDTDVFCQQCGAKNEVVQPAETVQPVAQSVETQPVAPQPVQPAPQPVQQAPQVVVNVGAARTTPVGKELVAGSYFDGGLAQKIGWTILAVLVTMCTLGLGAPWAICMLTKWETKHTVIEGRRLGFNGTGLQLWGKWIVWTLLTIITFGIYGFWFSIKMKQWVTSHTYFVN